MFLADLPEGAMARLVAVPAALAAVGLSEGTQIALYRARRTFLVIDTEGARFALSRSLARAVMVWLIRA